MDEVIAEIYDARGNLEGGVAPTLTGDHENRITDYTAIVVLNDQGGEVMDVSDIAGCLRAQDHGHPHVVCLNFQGSKSNNVVSDDGTAYSLNAMHGHDVHVVCFEPGVVHTEKMM